MRYVISATLIGHNIGTEDFCLYGILSLHLTIKLSSLNLNVTAAIVGVGHIKGTPYDPVACAMRQRLHAVLSC
jgi:hypothetical protein